MFSQTEINPRVLRRAIAHAALYLIVARKITRLQPQRSPNSVAIRSYSHQLYRQPVISLRLGRTAALVTKKLRVFSVIADQKILPPVVIVVPNCKSPSHMPCSKTLVLRPCHIHEARFAHISIQRLLFFICNFRMKKRNVVEDVPVDYQQIAPAIIVKIEKTRAKRTVQDIRLPDPRSDRVIRKSPVAI